MLKYIKYYYFFKKFSFTYFVASSLLVQNQIKEYVFEDTFSNLTHLPPSNITFS